MTKEARMYDGEKTASSISGAGKTGQPHAKEKKSRYRLYTLYKN